MAELNITNPVINNRYPGVNVKPGVEDYFVSTMAAVDTALLENEINHLQKIASYVDEKLLSNVSMVSMGPQLAAPTVKITGVENDASSLQELLASLRLAKSNNAINSDLLLSRLTKMIEDAQVDPAESKQSWDEFKQAHDNLLRAQAEVEKVILMLINFKAIAEPTQEDIDKVTKAANDAFTNVNTAMAKLIVTVKAVQISADQEHIDLIGQVKTNLENLGYVLLQIQKNMKESKIILLQDQAALYKMQQNELSEQLIEKAEKIKETQNKRATFIDAMKYLLMGLAVILAFASGGTLGVVAGMASAALLVLDLVTEGKVSEVLMAPVTAILVPMIEGIVTGISKAMKAAGCNEIASLIMGVVVAVVTVVATAFVAGKLASTIGGKLIDKFAPLFEKMVTVIADKLAVLTPYMDTIKKVANQVIDFIATVWNRIVETIQATTNPVFAALEAVLKPIVDLLKSVMESFKNLLASPKWLDDALDVMSEFLAPLLAKLETFLAKIKDGLKSVDKFLDDGMNYLLDGGHLDDFLNFLLAKLEQLPPTQKVLVSALETSKEASKMSAYLNSLRSLQSFITFSGMSTESGLTVASSKAEQDQKKLESDSVLINVNHDIVSQQISNTTDEWTKQLPVEDNFFKLASSLVQSRLQAVSTMYRNLAV